MNQCDTLICKVAFSFKVEGQRGRGINVKLGDKFWITSASYMIKRDGIVKIARKGKTLDDSYPFTAEIISQYFTNAG